MTLVAGVLSRETMGPVESGCRRCGLQFSTHSDVSDALSAGASAVFLETAALDAAPAVLKSIQAARSHCPAVPIVILARFNDRVVRRRAMSAGAADVLFLPVSMDEIEAELQEIFSDGGNMLDERGQDCFFKLRQTELIGSSPALDPCLTLLRRAAVSDANVLLLGETGTGKEIFARAIHKLSRRHGEPFLALNCATLHPNLAESELFGHARGAFTGAEGQKDGWLAAARAGTLLLDEIGDLDLTLQAKLLRATESREFQRIGETRSLSFSARIIAATSVDVDHAAEAGRFRLDLLGRLDQVRIKLPSLRERLDDIRLLVGHFLRKHSRGRRIDISESALSLLESYEFPRNVRQLENAIVHAVAQSGQRSTILPRDLPAEISAPASKPGEHYVIHVPKSLAYQAAREAAATEIDQIYLTELLKNHHNNQSAAADAAGIDRKTLAARLSRSHDENI